MQITVIAEEFRLPVAMQESAFRALVNLAGRETIVDAFGPHFAFVLPERLAKSSTLEELLSAWRWMPEVNDEEDIIYLEFLGEKLGDEDMLFATLAPYVTNGSYIAVVSDNFSIWRWVFEDGQVRREKGRLVFEGPHEYLPGG